MGIQSQRRIGRRLHPEMRFLIFTAREPRDTGLMAIATIRHHHPESLVVHLTDIESPALKGVDEVIRLPWVKDEPMTLRMNHLSELDAKPSVMLDTDVLVCSRLECAFESSFDVGLTLRPPPGETLMPYNTGVMFIRNPAFFAAVRNRMEREPKYKVWPHEQEAVAREAENGGWNVKDFEGAIWNFPPPVEKVSRAAKILHYKGDRKRYMRQHFESGLWRSGPY